MFNTLKYVKLLEEAGATRAYAETEVQIMAEIIGSNLATKQDMEDLRLATQQHFKDLRLATQQDLKDLRLATQHEMHDLRIANQQDTKGLRQDLVMLESKLETKIVQQTNKFIAAMAMILGIYLTLSKLL